MPAHAMQSKRHAHQDGNILIMAAIALSTAVILLASIDIGFLFYQKRELQKIADMAAIAGAQQLAKENGCASAQSIAIDNAKIAHNFSLEPNVTIGNWDTTTPSGNPKHFSPASCGQSPNAVHVRVDRSFGSFFVAWASQSVYAEAIATSSEPMAVFSVGSRLLRVEDGAVPGLLSAIGIDIDNTRLVSYEGLANASVKPSGLLQNLGFNIPIDASIGTIQEIVTTNTATGCGNGFCPLGVLLGAIQIGGQEQTLDVSSLGLNAEQLAVNVKFLSDETGRGILTFLETANGNAALRTDVNVLELVSAAIGAANSQRSKEISLTLNPTNMIGALPTIASATSRIGIVEPPSIGIGGKGAKAYSSQVRLFTHIESNLLNLNLLRADLPLSITLVNGEATIDDLCKKKIDGKDVATISVRAPILDICLGDITANNAFSSKDSCRDGLGPHKILHALNNRLIIDKSISLSLLSSGETQDFIKGETKTLGKNELALGTALEAILGQVLGTVLTGNQGSINNQNLAQILLSSKGTLTATTSFLQDALNLLKIFSNHVNSNTDLFTLIGSTLSGVLNTVDNLVNGLVNGLTNLLAGILCLGNAECRLSSELSGNQGSISKVLLSIVGLITNLLQPVLDGLGKSIANLMSNLLGLRIGEVDVTLIDLQCGSNVRLVH